MCGVVWCRCGCGEEGGGGLVADRVVWYDVVGCKRWERRGMIKAEVVIRGVRCRENIIR